MIRSGQPVGIVSRADLVRRLAIAPPAKRLSLSDDRSLRRKVLKRLRECGMDATYNYMRGGVQTIKTFASIKISRTFKFVHSKETHTMDAAIKTALVIAFAIVALLLLFFGGGMMTGTTMSGGMMGSGNMGGISWMWLPTLLVVVLGVVLFSVIFGKK